MMDIQFSSRIRPHGLVLKQFSPGITLRLHSVTDFINALPGDSSVNTVLHATIEEAVFSVDPTDAPKDWLDSDHMICVYCRSMSDPRLYNESREL
jgi:hypothetical protein